MWQTWIPPRQSCSLLWHSIKTNNQWVIYLWQNSRARKFFFLQHTIYVDLRSASRRCVGTAYMSPRKCRYHWVICLRAEHGLKQVKKSNFVHRKSKRPFPRIQKYHYTLCCPSKILNRRWGDCKSQGKLKTILMQNCGGATKSIMIFLTEKIHPEGWYNRALCSFQFSVLS